MPNKVSLSVIRVYALLHVNQGGKNMLVLGRKPGQYVMIDQKIKVEVVKSKDGDLRLAIDAPKDISIIRGEIYEKQIIK